MPTNWAQLLFSEPAVPRAAPRGPSTARQSMGAYTTQQIRALITQEARRQGIDPQLALAVATQESWLNPHAVGDNGRSLGLFQLQPAAAIDAGIDPRRRGEVPLNIRGGVTYLKQKLAQSGGNVEQALSRYNRGTPTYRGSGDPRYVANVLGHYRGADDAGQVRERVRPSGRLGEPQGAGSSARAGPRDWGAELFGTPAPATYPGTGADSAPGSPRHVDWGAALFGTPART